MMYVSQISMLFYLNLYNAVCQLYLNKTGKKQKRKPKSDVNKDAPEIPSSHEGIQLPIDQSSLREFQKLHIEQQKIPTLKRIGKAETLSTVNFPTDTATERCSQEGTYNSQLLPEEWRIWT